MICRSHLMSEIRNSVGGITYTKNRYAAIVARARVKPVDPQSCNVEHSRRRFNTAAIQWKSLTDLQRASWNTFANDTPWTNGFGETVYLTGQAMYIGQVTAASAMLGTAARAGYNTAPCIPGMFPTPEMIIGCCTNPTIGVTVEVVNMHSTNVMDAIVRISPPQSPSVRYYNGPYDSTQAILLQGIAAGASDDAEFCPLCEAKYFFQIRALDVTLANNMSTLTHCNGIACTDPV